MTDPTKAQLAMARQIYAQFIIDNVPGSKPDDAPVFDDNAHGVKIALAAIIETQRLDAELAGTMIPMPGNVRQTNGTCAQGVFDVATAIRAGHHYGKDEG